MLAHKFLSTPILDEIFYFSFRKVFNCDNRKFYKATIEKFKISSIITIKSLKVYRRVLIDIGYQLWPKLKVLFHSDKIYKIGR